ncbi:sel1 repeat family protein, partial [Rhizobium lentis]|nr:sel1 repeat family protein [Rhizobium lentis]
MVTSEFKLFKFMLVSMWVAILLSGPVHAFDIKSDVSKESGPFDLFKFGFKAYKNGQKEEAVEA